MTSYVYLAATYVIGVSRKTVIDASRKDLAAVSICPHRLCSTFSTAIWQTYNQVVLLQLYANPIIALTSDIEESCAVSNVSDFLILV